MPVSDGAALRHRHPSHSKLFAPESLPVEEDSENSSQRQTGPQQPEKKHEILVILRVWRHDPAVGDGCRGASRGTLTRSISGKQRTSPWKITRYQIAQLIHDDPDKARHLTRPYFKAMDEAVFDAAFDKYAKGLPTDPVITPFADFLPTLRVLGGVVEVYTLVAIVAVYLVAGLAGQLFVKR